MIRWSFTTELEVLFFLVLYPQQSLLQASLPVERAVTVLEVEGRLEQIPEATCLLQ